LGGKKKKKDLLKIFLYLGIQSIEMNRKDRFEFLIQFSTFWFLFVCFVVVVCVFVLFFSFPLGPFSDLTRYGITPAQ